MAATREQVRNRIALAANLLVLLLLVGLTIVAPPPQVKLLPGLLFGVLMVFTLIFGIRVSEGSVSLLPMTVTAAYLALGLLPAGWLMYVSAILHGVIRYRWSTQLEENQEPSDAGLVARTATNATMHTASILAGGAVYQVVGGATPLMAVDRTAAPRLLLLGLTYLCVNYLIAGFYIATRGQRSLRAYLRTLPNAVLYEGAPLIFAVLMALIYTRLGLAYLALFAVNLVAGSLITRYLDLTNRRLGRRVRELDSLQAVGQALSTTLDVEAIVSAIYGQVSRLMPAREFFVALYESATDEVTFPLVVEEGKRVQWRSRQAGNGLTEYVLRTQAPLLIPQDFTRTTAGLGLDHIGREAACWLGVPMLAGATPLGVIAVQSYDTTRAYDGSHQKVLQTIASQAAAAIQNARLYARTDEALSRRVQELDSILRSSRDGYLLLDMEWCVLTINRTLADWLNVSQTEVDRQPVDASLPDGETLIRRIGYTTTALAADCQAIMVGGTTQKQAIILLGPTMRHVERTLIPVKDQEGAITDWMLSFRDMTEEMELGRLRDDMTEMLVHDLRSPLTAVMGSLALMREVFDDGDREGFERLQLMAQHSSDRILRIVNQLLDISRLESGQLPLEREQLGIATLLEEVARRFEPLTEEADIETTVEAAPGLPTVHADRSLINRVLDNLLDNAIKFTPDGGQVRLWACEDRGRAPGGLLIGVTDSGRGIPQEAQARLFSKFQQVSSVEGRRRGTGLGLAFCRLAVEAHGGQIWVESELDKGSTFLFTLPIVKAPPLMD
jgi:NtrC-family two-component system sensor histidine kinase KinB